MPVTVPEQQDTGTLITNTLWNQIVDAVAHVLGMKADGDTLANADAGKTIGWDIGDIKASSRVNDISNAWLLCNGRTIGDSSSGGTARANADMATLFSHLWTEFADSELAVSSGRGASAAADFAAHKTITLPDLRGRIIAGMDNPGSGAANRVTDAQADKMGGSMGAETQALTTAQLSSHAHYQQYNTTGAGGSPSTLQVSGSYWNTGTVTLTPNPTANSGSGSAHNNVQPTYFVNYFIYTGN